MSSHFDRVQKPGDWFCAYCNGWHDVSAEICPEYHLRNGWGNNPGQDDGSGMEAES